MYLDYEIINISFKANVFLNFDSISLEKFNPLYECKLKSLKFSFFYLLKYDIYIYHLLKVTKEFNCLYMKLW